MSQHVRPNSTKPSPLTRQADNVVDGLPREPRLRVLLESKQTWIACGAEGCLCPKQTWHALKNSNVEVARLPLCVLPEIKEKKRPCRAPC